MCDTKLTNLSQSQTRMTNNVTFILQSRKVKGQIAFFFLEIYARNTFLHHANLGVDLTCCTL